MRCVRLYRSSWARLYRGGAKINPMHNCVPPTAHETSREASVESASLAWRALACQHWLLNQKLRAPIKRKVTRAPARCEWHPARDALNVYHALAGTGSALSAAGAHEAGRRIFNRCSCAPTRLAGAQLLTPASRQLGANYTCTITAAMGGAHFRRARPPNWRITC